MRIVFFGASRFVLSTIEILNKNFKLLLVVTTEQQPSDALPLYCSANNIPYLSVSKFTRENKQQIKNIHAPVALLASFGLLVPTEVLNIFPNGILNIHPSLLPLYRGPTPVQSTILNGDSETGVTIIKLDEQLDHGPIVTQQKELIHKTDTTQTLQNRLFEKASPTLISIIPDYVKGKINLQDQKEQQATFTKRLLTRLDGYFDSDNPPSKQQLDRMIRAFYPWPTAWTKFETAPGISKRVKLLPGNKIQVEGGKPMSIKDFLNGYPNLKEKIEKILITT